MLLMRFVWLFELFKLRLDRGLPVQVPRMRYRAVDLDVEWANERGGD
jgi:hypothetical protein